MQGLLRKTLIIRLSSVGDIILSSLLVRALRKKSPGSQIDYLVKSEFAELLNASPHLSTVLELPPGAPFADLRRVRTQIHGAGYDLIIDIHDSLRSRFLTFGGPPTVRIRKRKLARWLLVRFKLNLYARLGGAPGVAERYLEPVQAYGVDDDGQGLELFLREREVRIAEETLRPLLSHDGGPIVGIAPSARHWNKRWPADRFADAAIEIHRNTKARILLFGAANEHELCSAIEQRIHAQAPRAAVMNLAGRLTLIQTAAAMDHCSAIVSNDSGLMHIAAARQRPVVALFGPTVRELGFFPFRTPNVVLEREDVPCRPCTHIGLPTCPRKHFRCMLDITVPVVVAATENFLEQ